MARKRALPPAPAPCAPTGDLAAWPVPHYRCDCGEEVRPVRMAPAVNDWTAETLTGERSRWEGPELLRTDPKAFWEDLRVHMAAGDVYAANVYSVWQCRQKLGMLNFWHYHRTQGKVLTPRPDRAPPFCCESSMWASPDGWMCRKSGRLFTYADASASV